MRSAVAGILAGILFVSLLGLAGCATVDPPRPELSNIPPLENGWSRLFISAGHFKSPLLDVETKNTSNTGPVYINGQKVGATAYKEQIAVDLKAGLYELYWTPTAPDKFLSEKMSLNLQENQIRYFSCDMTTTAAASFGLLGAIASDYLYKGWLTEEPLDKTGKLVSYFKLADTPISRPLNNSAMPVPQDTETRLLKLKGAYDQNLISKDEYENKKKDILKEL